MGSGKREARSRARRPLGEPRRRLGAGPGRQRQRRGGGRPRAAPSGGAVPPAGSDSAGRAVGERRARRRPAAKEKGGGGGADGTGRRLPAVTLGSPPRPGREWEAAAKQGASMAETSPPPAAGAESCSGEPARGAERRPEEREGEAGPPLASPAGQPEPDSPVAAPFFLLYPSDGGAGFSARPPPQQQRAWRTPPSPGSPLPFLLLSYPGGGGGGGGKHREWQRGRGSATGKGGLGREGPARSYGAPPPAGAPERGAGQRGGRGAGAALGKPLAGGRAGCLGAGRPLVTSESPQAAGSRRPPLPGRAGRWSSPASHVLAGSQPRGPGREPSREKSRRGRRPGTQQPRWSAFCGLRAPRRPSRCGCCAAAAGAASVVPLNVLRAFTPHP